MLKNNKDNHLDCFTTDDLVSYLYDEVTPSERGRLDVHLAGCRTCTEDFASLSESRFSVYEWQRSDFAGIETPVITGPWENLTAPAARPLLDTGTLSWTSRIKALFGPSPAWAVGAAAFAVLAVAAWVGISNLASPSNVDEARQIQKPAEEKTVPAAIDSSPRVAINVEPRHEDVKAAKVAERTPEKHQFKSEVATTSNLKSVHQPRSGMDLNGRKSEMAINKTPNLSGIEEDEDTTVRLSDLFAEVGSENENN